MRQPAPDGLAVLDPVRHTLVPARGDSAPDAGRADGARSAVQAGRPAGEALTLSPASGAISPASGELGPEG
ncbi:hypothetical protein ACIF6L_02970 [Kitasatospora sp. NPDC086009]|uniref:hypothetical protein n=1 Tax=Kitasatospora sp. NPDC086009 TaxID=3364065 RepID=UPI0036E96F9D